MQPTFILNNQVANKKVASKFIMFLQEGENIMSVKSKFVYLLLVLIFAFTSLAAGAVVSVELAAHDAYSDTAYHVNTEWSGPSFVIAGECDAGPTCGGGGG